MTKSAGSLAPAAALLTTLAVAFRQAGFQRFVVCRGLNAGDTLLNFLQVMVHAFEDFGLMLLEFFFMLLLMLGISLRRARRRGGLCHNGGGGQKKSNQKQFFHW